MTERLAPPPVFKLGCEFSEARMIEDKAREEEEENKRNGRPAHEPNEGTKASVTLLCAFGFTHDQIAKYIGLGSRQTLTRHYRHELENAEMLVDAAVIAGWMKLVQKGSEMTILRYMERKFLKPDTSHIPLMPTPEEEEVNAESMKRLIQQVREEF